MDSRIMRKSYMDREENKSQMDSKQSRSCIDCEHMLAKDENGIKHCYLKPESIHMHIGSKQMTWRIAI